MFMFSNYLLICVVSCLEENYNPLKDVKKCKLSHSGSEYKGDVSRSFSGYQCRYWDSSNPLYTVDSSLSDADFPDHSRRAARNYCRNPNGKYAMPWCYTLDPNVIDDACDVPLCAYPDCRITGPGVEYAGNVNKTASDRACVVWSEKTVRQYELDHNKTLASSDEHKRKLPAYKFPDGSRTRAMNRCRNPNGNVAGPWCLVEHDSLSDRTKYELEYCNVPFCEQPECSTFTSGDSTQIMHTHYSVTHLSEDDATIVFGLRLWNPEQWRNARFRLALSMIPFVASGKVLREMNVGLEILVQFDGSELTLTDGEESDFASSYSLVDFTQVKYFAINWAGGFISFGFQGQVKPLWIQEYKEDDSTLIGLHKGVWKYMSILGGPATWSFPFCKTGCEEHITLHFSPSRLWPLKRSPFKGYELQLYVRARAHAIISLRPGPGVAFPRVNIVLLGVMNKTVLTIQSSEETEEEIAVSMYEKQMLDYWKFTSVKITIIGDKLEAYWFTEDLLEPARFITYAHESIRLTRWFSLASGTVAHWTIYCQPNETSTIPKAVQPECIMDVMGAGYNGSQWTSYAGYPCVPWNSKNIPQIPNAKFPDVSLVASSNQCRNPTRDLNGPFCFTTRSGLTLDTNGDHNPVKEYCKPRFCQSAACKLSGLGTDYFGLKSITKSGRICQAWNSKTPHKIDKNLQNDDLYPSRSVKLAKNYCRNPSRSSLGPWCYTMDPLLERDACDVRDCDKSEQCTLVITSSRLRDRNKYILPEWRNSGVAFALKVWDPQSYDTMHVVLEGLNSSEGHFDLIIGHNRNQYVTLLWTDLTGKQFECSSILMPHLIAAAKWTGFWLKLPRGQLLLGRDGTTGPIFQWDANDAGPCPRVRFDLIGFYVEAKGKVAANIDCKQCHTEITKSDVFDQKYALSMWKLNFTKEERSSFRMHVRAEGGFKIGLFMFPESSQYIQISFSNSSALIHSVEQNRSLLKYSAHSNVPHWSDYKWNDLTVLFSEQTLYLIQNGTLFLQWNSSSNLPLVYYHLSIACSIPGTKVTWTLNCDPPDIDGSPRAGGWGGWGPWVCSVPCGGGKGIRERFCDTPSPNILGTPCPGSNVQVGQCNTFPCGQVSPYTRALISESLKREARTLTLQQGDNLSISCDLNLMRRIANESPTADFEWNKNGFRLGRRATDVKDLNETHFSLNITSVQVHNSGVYTCLVLPDIPDDSRLVISIISVLIISDTNATRSSMKQGLTLRVGDKWKLMCNSGVLAQVYAGLVQRWLLNGKVYMRETYVAMHSERDMIYVNYSHEGAWECHVQHKELNLTWVTNWTRLHVLSRASIFTYVLEDKFSAPLVSWLGSERNVVAFLRFMPLLMACLVLLYVLFYKKLEKDIYGTRDKTAIKYERLSQPATRT